jgi:16S rRNA (uracil1498-N3)-methyltransferase
VNIFIAHINDQLATLTTEESWHCTKVLRKKTGDKVHLIDGIGNFYEGTLELISEKKCTASITKGPLAQSKRNYHLHLAIAPTKQMDRIEWMVEKAIEIGCDEISFFYSKNSERSSVKTERIVKIVESAVKQSLQALIPKVNELVTFKELINNQKADQKLIAHCYDLPKTNIKEIQFKNLTTLVLIGPEGDFTTEEVDQALQQNYKTISLGNNRLRSETAGLYVCQAASILT